MAVPVDDYLKASDKLLKNLERDALANAAEAEAIRREMVAGIRAIQVGAVQGMKAARVGRARILVPTGTNYQKVNLAASRTRERFSKFRLQWLDKAVVRDRISQGWTKADQREFFRHSNRLARNARTFLREIAELEPSLEEEVRATTQQIDDGSNDLLKLEVRSFTRVSENLRRAVNGRMTKAGLGRTAQTFDLDRNLWNLSLLEHPKGTVRELLANSSEKMAARLVKETGPELARRAHVFVGAGPGSIAQMRQRPDSRTAKLVWRVFSAEQLQQQARKLAVSRQSLSSWRDLGQGYGTQEWYVPIPPETLDGVEKAMRKRRSEFIASVQRGGQR